MKLDADVYGLMEIANNGYGPNSAIAHLTSALGSDWNFAPMLFGSCHPNQAQRVYSKA
jgi:predicted extracellular nuclease